MKKLISILCTAILFATSFATYATPLDGSTGYMTANGTVITLTQQELDDIVDIDADVAREVAKLFVRDSSADENICWNESTYVTDVVPMYDGNGDVTAYTVLFDSGYVVVSAYLDAESLIPEWSDVGVPVYAELNAEADDKIIYLGAYEYYVDNGESEVTGLNGATVKKAELLNMIEPCRDVSNIPEQAVLYYKSAELNGDPEIVDPIGYANRVYGGSFSYTSRTDFWTNYMDYMVMAFGSSYAHDNHCGPTAITNIFAGLRNRYGTSKNITTIPSSNNELYLRIANYGMEHGYFSVSSGTPVRTIYNYIREISLGFGITPYQMFQVTDNCSDVTEYLFPLSYGAIYYVSVGSHPIYGNHGVAAYGISQMSNQYGVSKNFFHICDGWGETPRYLEINSYINRVIGIEFY